MSGTPVASIIEHFKELKDPRIERRKRHKLLDIMIMALCGADTWVDIQRFGCAKRKWLRQFLELPNGIPSHDTFGRVFARLDAQQFQACFLQWVQAVFRVTGGEILAVDGKRLRGSGDSILGKDAIQMVSVWATQNRLVLGQVKVEQGSNEITAIPPLLRLLQLSGCIVTLDALGCQKEIAETILAQGGDYVLAVKGNQGQLYRDLVSLFEDAQSVKYRHIVHDYCQTVDKGHGRLEIRQCWTVTDAVHIAYRRDLRWEGLQSMVMVAAERRIGTESSMSTRYFISSLRSSARQMLHVIRERWGIENSLHWILDIAFGEDKSRVRRDDAAENLVVLRHIALNLLSQEKTASVGIKAKRLMAAWDEEYLLQVLGN